MAVTFTDLARTIANTVAASSYTNGGGNFTPVAGRLYLVVTWYAPHTASGGTINGVTSTTGLSFDLVSSAVGGTGDPALAVFRAEADGSETAGTYSVTFTNNRTGCTAFLIEVDGQDTSGTNGDAAVINIDTGGGTTANPSITLAAFSHADNGTFGCFGFEDRTAPTPGGAFTEIGGNPDIGSPNIGCFGEYATDNQTTVDCTHGAVFWRGIAFEVVAAAGGGPAQRFNHGLLLGVN